MGHFSVHQLVDFNTEVEINDAYGVLALKLVKEELENQKRHPNRLAGKHPDGIHCDAQICLNGHVQHCDGMPFDSKARCSQCGEPCIDECTCGEPIRGVQIYKAVDEYVRPAYCHRCGRPYPWMDRRLTTARELLDHDDELTLDERNSLWDDLQYVMSDPKADLVPAKKKLIAIKLKKATENVRDHYLPDNNQSVTQKRKRGDASYTARIAPWKWQPGQSGNPGGRPKHDLAAEIARAIFENNAPMIYEAYRKMLQKGNAYAFQVLSERAFGKLKESVQHEISPYHQMTDDEIRERIKQLEKELGIPSSIPEALPPSSELNESKPN